jgi:hypothetical protein
MSAVFISRSLRSHSYDEPGKRSDNSFSVLPAHGHGGLSNSPVSWRCGALLLTLRGPPDFWFRPPRDRLLTKHLFLVPRENAEPDLESRS